MKKIDQSVATREFHVCFVFYVHHIVMSAERDLIFERYQNALVLRRNLIPRNQNEVLQLSVCLNFCQVNTCLI